MTKRKLTLSLAAVLLAGTAQATPRTLTFEGVGDNTAVGDFYGADYVFSSSAFASVSFAGGGTGDHSGEPSPFTVMFFLDANDAFLNVRNGFTNNVRLSYSSVGAATVRIWDGLNGTGNLLQTVTLGGQFNDGCTGATFCNWTPVRIAFDGTARSIDFSGAANQTGFDNLVFGSLFRLAQASMRPLEANLGNRRVGDAVGGRRPIISVSNTAAADGQSEQLSATLVGTTGNARITSGSGVSLLDAGSTATAYSYSVSTEEAGPNGTITLAFTSDGRNTSGDGETPLGTQTLRLLGGVFRYAEGAVEAATDRIVARVGDVATRTIGIVNRAVADGFSESLGVEGSGDSSGVTFSSADGLISAGERRDVTATVDTSSAGAKAGTLKLIFRSNGTGTSGLASVERGGGSATVLADVYRYAEAAIVQAAERITARVGDVAERTITIRNTAAADGFSEGLGVSGLVSGSGVTFAPTAGLVAAGGALDVTAQVDTATAGVKSGALNLAFTSDGTGTSGLAAVGIGGGTATVDADVYAPAAALIAPGVVDFGIVRVGDTVAARAITIGNGATGALTDTLIVNTGAAPTGFAVGAAPGPLAAGEEGQIEVTIDTAVAAAHGGELPLGLISRNPVLADLALDGRTVLLTGMVNALARPVFTVGGVELVFDAGLDGYVFDFGTVPQGRRGLIQSFEIANLIMGPADLLSGLLSDADRGDPFLLTGASVGPLAAGAGQAFDLNLRTRDLGMWSGRIDFAGLSTNASDLDGLAVGTRLFLFANVTPDEVPAPSASALLALGFALAIGLRRSTRRRAVRPRPPAC